PGEQGFCVNDQTVLGSPWLLVSLTRCTALIFGSGRQLSPLENRSVRVIEVVCYGLTRIRAAPECFWGWLSLGRILTMNGRGKQVSSSSLRWLRACRSFQIDDALER